MAYENDGYLAYVLTTTHEDGTTSLGGETIFGDREQAQALANCLTEKAAAQKLRRRYGVAGIAVIPDVPVGASYTGPFHSADDECQVI